MCLPVSVLPSLNGVREVIVKAGEKRLHISSILKIEQSFRSGKETQ